MPKQHPGIVPRVYSFRPEELAIHARNKSARELPKEACIMYNSHNHAKAQEVTESQQPSGKKRSDTYQIVDEGHCVPSCAGRISPNNGRTKVDGASSTDPVAECTGASVRDADSRLRIKFERRICPKPKDC